MDEPGITNGDELVVLEGLSKSYATADTRIEILREVDFKIKRGESLAVVGASGIGKSTLLHIIGTLDRPNSGRLLFEGDDLLQFDEIQLARFRNRSIGFVFQFHHLLPEFSAIENAMMPALIQGLDRDDSRKRSEALLVRVGLKDRLHHRVNDLSGGEQQRVALARALVLQPAMLLADEPTGNLDVKNGEQIHQLLMDLNRELQMTLMVVTHNLDLASRMGRRVTIVGGQLMETIEVQ